MKSKGYTLWLMPKGANYDKFSGLIRKLAQAYHAPIFEPHITLLGEIMLPEEEVIRRTDLLVKGQKPFTTTLKTIDYEDYYFRTLFVRAEKTSPLLKLYNSVKEIFQMDILPYMPHLSLLYGTFPNEVKEKIIEKLGRDQTTNFNISSVHLVRGGEVEKWQIIREFPFRL